jgi:membrane associated rhomboid family serine protease
MSYPLFVLMAAVGTTASADLSRLLVLDVREVMNGQLWRLWTGHLSHLTWIHLLLDGPIFVLLFATFSRLTNTASAIALSVVSAVAISSSVVLIGRHELYGGLSGLSSAAMAAIIFTALLQHPRAYFLYVVGLLFLVYVLHGEGLGVVPVAHEAHVAGAVTGLLFVGIRESFVMPHSLTKVLDA